MAIIFTEHSILKQKQRGIPKKLVIEAINKPDNSFKGYSNREIIYKKFGKRYLKVIVKKENSDIIVITQHWEQKLKSRNSFNNF